MSMDFEAALASEPESQGRGALFGTSPHSHRVYLVPRESVGPQRRDGVTDDSATPRKNYTSCLARSETTPRPATIT